MTEDERFMLHCIELAKKGLGSVAPNPMVGAIIVADNEIIGQGYHAKFGEDHAEIAAIKSVKNPELFTKSTIYVTLEPCNHQGKTPPCSDAIIEKGIGRVVIGSVDKNPIVSGKGIEKLRNKGITVETGILEKDCNELNKRFFTFHERKRPYIILKWAESQDGYFAPTKGKQKWISNDILKKQVHKWRTEEQAILVGTSTTSIDNPQLTARLWKGKQPLRVIIDKTLKIPRDYNIFNSDAKSLIFNELKTETSSNIHFKKIDFTENIWNQIFNELYALEIQSIIVEGGQNVLNQLIELNLYEEIRLIRSANKMEEGIPAPVVRLSPFSEETFLDNQLITYRNLHPN